MCGIVTKFHKSEKVNRFVLERYQDQISRGTDGYGAMFIQKDGSFNLERSTDEVKAIIDLKMQPCNMIMFHHRNPTSSDNTTSQTHPILLSCDKLDYDYLFMHNGVMRNHEGRFKWHKENGYKYSTEEKDKDGDTVYNDSESLGLDIVRWIEGKSKKVRSRGGAAFVIARIKDEKIDKIYFGRNGDRPLKMSSSRDHVMLASEGRGNDVKKDTLYSFKLDDFKISRTKILIDIDPPKPKTKPIHTPGHLADPLGVYSSNHREIGYNTGNIDTTTSREFLPWDEARIVADAEKSAFTLLDEVFDSMKEGHDDIFNISIKDVMKEIEVYLTTSWDTALKVKSVEKMKEAQEEKAK